MTTAMLTEDEARGFLRDRLDLPDTVGDELLSPRRPGSSTTPQRRLDLLNDIIFAFSDHIPFQTLNLMSCPVDFRRRPSWAEVKEDGLSGRGGLCYSQNVFLFVLLRTLGYEVSVTHGTMPFAAEHPKTHVIVLVSSLLDPGDLYFVDCGLGSAVLRAVSLTAFEGKSPTYRDSFLDYYFVREAEDRIIFWQRKYQPVLEVDKESRQAFVDAVCSAFYPRGSSTSKTVCDAREEETTNGGKTTQPPSPMSSTSSPSSEGSVLHVDVSSMKTTCVSGESKWVAFCVFDPQVRHTSLEPFYPYFDDCYSDVTALPHHTSPRALRWWGGRMVGLVNSKLYYESPDGQIIKCQLLHTRSTHLGGGGGQVWGQDGGEKDVEEAKVLEDFEAVFRIRDVFFQNVDMSVVLAALVNWGVSQGAQPIHLP